MAYCAKIRKSIHSIGARTPIRNFNDRLLSLPKKAIKTVSLVLAVMPFFRPGLRKSTRLTFVQHLTRDLKARFVWLDNT
jgi:hypothetical protein